MHLKFILKLANESYMAYCPRMPVCAKRPLEEAEKLQGPPLAVLLYMWTGSSYMVYNLLTANNGRTLCAPTKCYMDGIVKNCQ